MSRPHKPHGGCRPKGRKNGDTLDRRLESYFNENPEEELTPQDIQEKFGNCADYVRDSVLILIKEGFLERVTIIRKAPLAGL